MYVCARIYKLREMRENYLLRLMDFKVFSTLLFTRHGYLFVFSNGNVCLQPLIETAILLLSWHFIVHAFSTGALSSPEYSVREQYIQGYLNHLFRCIISSCVLHCQ